LRAQLDENLPVALARALNSLAEKDGHEVLHVLDLVDRGTKDVDLFAAVKQAGIQIHITQDHHYRRPIERDAIAGAGLVVFVLNKGWATQQFYAKAARLVEWWPRIAEQAESVRPPAVFRVPWHKNGKGKFEQIRITK
jgi:hypothetical protein